MTKPLPSPPERSDAATAAPPPAPRIRRAASRWSWVRDPIRPSPEGLASYERLLEAQAPRRVLVMGATPEIVDLLVRRGVEEIVSVDQDGDTAAAMRLLGRASWAGVRFERGTWTELGSILEAGSVDAILSDGGPLYLVFPADWERLFYVLREVLRPGGIFATRLFALPEETPTFGSVLAATQARWRRDPEALEAEVFARDATALSVATRMGSCDSDGNFDREVVERHFELFREVLFEWAPRADLAPVVDAHFGDGKRACDASPLRAGARAEPVADLVRRCGFEPEIEALPDRVPVPGCYYMLAARRR